MTRLTQFGLDRHDAALEQAEAHRQTTSLAALAILLALVVAALFLMRKLSAEAALEDCLMAGRHDCEMILADR